MPSNPLLAGAGKSATATATSDSDTRVAVGPPPHGAGLCSRSVDRKLGLGSDARSDERAQAIDKLKTTASPGDAAGQRASSDAPDVKRKVREACHKHLRTIHPDKSGGIYSKDVAEAVSKMINDIKEQAV